MQRTWTTLAGLALALAAGLGTLSPARADDKDNNRDASKLETIRGVIAGVTVAGETAIDYSTRRAQAVEMSYLTVVGSPVRDGKSGGSDAGGSNNANANSNDQDKNKANSNDQDKNKTNANSGSNANANASSGSGRRRHNLYIVWLTPMTEVRDATSSTSSTSSSSTNKSGSGNDANRNAWGAIEVGDRVEVTFERREIDRSGGNAQGAQGGQDDRRHGRHRTFFGNARSIKILAMPAADQGSARSSDNKGDRDDDADKVKKR